MKMFSVRRVVIASFWLVTMVAALGAGAYGHKYRQQIRALFSSVQGGAAIMTNLEMVKVEKVMIPAEGRDGGIAVLDDGLLFVNRMGRAWYVDAAKKVTPLALRVPINFDEFTSDPFNKTTILHDLFSVKDIAVQNTETGVRVFASHNHWYSKERCNTLRLSVLETSHAQLMATDVPAEGWRTVFETQPCRALEKTPEGGHRAGLGVGGRIALLPDGDVLLSIGGFDPENELIIQAPQKLDNTYGKTMRINPVTGESRPFTIGHRNPQGLATTSTGEVWLTEHAARGGDELNLLSEGKNFGYPLVSYGTQYDAMVWPLSKAQGRHDGFDKPMFVWTPSIGISQLIAVEKDMFPTWRGDLLVSSLNGQSLFRVRVEDGRVIFAEPIPIGHRIRDIVEAADGSIVLKTDDNFLVYLSALNATTAATAAERGAILAATCQSCHSLGYEGNTAIGPRLWKVVGRPVASEQNYNYSAALRGVGGRWTPERLQAFLQNPSEFAPGTSMQIGRTFTEQEAADLVVYLQGLK